MISYALYKTLHVAAVLFVFTALGALTLHAYNGGSRETNRGRLLTAIGHGLGLVMVLVTGFGLIARLGLGHTGVWPLWIYLKLAVWLILGAVLVVINRAPRLAGLLWIAIPLLGAIAAGLAIFKPGV